VTVDGEVVSSIRAPLAPLGRWAGFPALDASLVLEVFRRLCDELRAQRPEGQSLAVGLSCEGDSVLFVGSENALSSPILFGSGLPLSRSEVPPELTARAQLTALYRSSPLRQASCREPDPLSGVRRVVSLDALLAHEMTSEWVASAACPPVGVPFSPGTSDYSEDPEAWFAVGCERSATPLLIGPANVRGQLTRAFAERCGLPLHTPLIATSDPIACRSYGLKSNAAGWFVGLGAGLAAGWIGPTANACRNIQIAIQEAFGEPAAPSATMGERAQSPEEADEASPQWTEEEYSGLVWEQLQSVAHRGRVLGPRRGLSSFRLRAQAELLDAMSGRFVSWTADAGGLPTPIRYNAVFLEAVAVGCEGLRYLPGAETGLFLGLRAGHEEPHWVRAYVEGMMLELRRWRALAGVRSVEPPRVVFEPPWELSLAHLLADVLGEPVFAWDDEPDLPAHIGQALAISRDLQLGTDGATPTLSLRVVEPGPRAATYEKQYGLYLSLLEETRRLLF